MKLKCFQKIVITSMLSLSVSLTAHASDPRESREDPMEKFKQLCTPTKHTSSVPSINTPSKQKEKKKALKHTRAPEAEKPSANLSAPTSTKKKETPQAEKPSSNLGAPTAHPANAFISNNNNTEQWKTNIWNPFPDEPQASFGNPLYNTDQQHKDEDFLTELLYAVAGRTNAVSYGNSLVSAPAEMFSWQNHKLPNPDKYYDDMDTLLEDIQIVLRHKWSTDNWEEFKTYYANFISSLDFWGEVYPENTGLINSTQQPKTFYNTNSPSSRLFEAPAPQPSK